MKKLFLLSLLAVLVLAPASKAQLRSSVVAIVPFASAEKKDVASTKELQAIVTEVFSSKKYIKMLDRSKIALIKKELDRQKGPEYLDGKTVKQGKATGADVIITGTLTNIIDVKTTIGGKVAGQSQDEDASTHKGTISFSLQAFDVATGELLDNNSFEVSAMDGSNMDLAGILKKESSNQAASVVRFNKKNIEEKVGEWVDQICPPYLKIVTIDETTKRGVPVLVSILGGNDAGLKQNMQIILYESNQEEIGDRVYTRKTIIGKLKVTEFQGDFTQCKILEGGTEIMEKWKNENIQLLVDYSNKPLIRLPRTKS